MMTRVNYTMIQHIARGADARMRSDTRTVTRSVTSVGRRWIGREKNELLFLWHRRLP